MKILVTGSDGQLGLCLKDQFNDTFHNVFYSNKNDLDITDASNIKIFLEKNKPEIIINCAAFTQVDRSEDDYKTANLINNIAVKNLARTAEKNDIRLIHISTDYVFDGLKGTDYCETDDCNPINKYGETKYLGEKQIIKSGCNYVIIRTSWVFSEYKNNFVKTMLSLAEKHRTLQVIDDQTGTPTYAGDLAKFIKFIINSNYIDNSIINFCGDKACTWFSFAEKIFQVAKENSLKIPANLIPVKTKDLNFRAKRPKLSVLSTKLLKKKYNMRPSNWQFMLNKVIKNYKK